METNKTTFARERYNKTAPFYNFMEWPTELFVYRKWRNEFFRHVAGPKVLEIGVGTGRNMSYYPPDKLFVGIDLSEGMMQRAKSHKPENARLMQMDAEHLGYADNTFDTVIATFVFCSIPNPNAALQEIKRVLKPNGRLLLMEHVLPEKRVLRWFFQKTGNFVYNKTGVHIDRQTGTIISESGLTLDRNENLLATIFRRFFAVKFSEKEREAN